jgi:hypothetical protein
MIRCQECGFKNADAKQICDKCGSKIYDLSSANFNPDALRVNHPTDSLRTIKVIREEEPEKEKPEKEKTEFVQHHTQPLSALNFEEAEKIFFLVNEKTGEKMRFESGEKLRRDNLAVGNQSISENEHAQISFVNGQWQMEDKSTNGATFVQVKNAVSLQKGMRIIVGNQILKFEE